MQNFRPACFSHGTSINVIVGAGFREDSFRVERRLTSIMAADVVGYSRLVGADEGERFPDALV